MRDQHFKNQGEKISDHYTVNGQSLKTSKNKTRSHVMSKLWTLAILVLTVFLFTGVASSATVYEELYTSSNLDGHEVFAECNPAGGTDCPCSEEDVDINSFEDYGQVTSNVLLNNAYVNAIGAKRFFEEFPNGDPLALGVYKYSGKFRLPGTPFYDPAQKENAQAVHMMIQLWDGRNELYEANRYSLEAAIYYELNPWSPNYGKIYVYTEALQFRETGITLEPDNEWHSFEMEADLTNQEWISITIDNKKIDAIRGVPLTKVYRPETEYGDEVMLAITTESMASWPQYECPYVFTWTTEFKDLDFGRLREE